MALRVELTPVTPKSIPQEHLSTVFYIGDYYYVFYDQSERQLAFTQREFKLIQPHLEKIEQALSDEGLLVGQEAGIVYDFVHRKFRLTHTNQEPKHQIVIDQHMERINAAAQNIQFYVISKPKLKEKDKPKPAETYKERIVDTSKRMRKADINQYMEDFSKDKKITHLMDPTQLDYKKLKNQDFVFVSLTKDGHVTSLAFDIKKKRGYYYDPAGKPIQDKSHKHADQLCKKMSQNLGIKKVTTNTQNHQNGNFHCGRYVLNFYKQIAEHPGFDIYSFCNKPDHNIQTIIDYLLIAPQGLTNRGNDCFLNAMFQTLLTSDQAKFYSNASNLNDPTNEASKELHAQFVHLMNEYKKGARPSTNAFRQLLGFNDKRQHDATEALGAFTHHYKDHSPLISLNLPESVNIEQALQKRTEARAPHIYITPQMSEYDFEDKKTYKLEYCRDIPETLQINGQTYKLQSFITHHGNKADSGHYTADVMQNSCWYSCDDSVVTPINDPLEKAKSAYVLHYRRTSDSASMGG